MNTILYFSMLLISYAQSQIISLTPSMYMSTVGQSVTFNCNVGLKDGNWVHLLRQIPGEAPKLIIYNHHSVTSPKYGPGIPSDRFTSTINSEATVYQFIIKKAETEDTALYYCVKWYGSPTAYHSDAQSQTISLTPSMSSSTVGQSVTFSCNVGLKDGSWVYLLRQIPGEAPQRIISNHHSATSPSYGPGISSDRFTSTINNEATVYQFIIKKAETEDTALYYCVKWYGSPTAYHNDVQSQAISLTPSMYTSTVGQSVTFKCNIGPKDGDWVHFLRQIPGEAPQLIIYNHNSVSSPRYGPGISSDRFTSTINIEATKSQFIIKKVDIEDTALYYCVKWYSHSAYHNVDKFPEPAILVFTPQTEDLDTKEKSTIACHISKLTVGLANVKWLVDGTTVQDGVSTSQPVRETDNTFSMSSYLSFPSSDINKDKIYSCWIQQEGSSSFTSKGIKLSQC